MEKSGDYRLRLVDRFDPRVVNVLTVLGLGLPVVGYLWYVGYYSVNVPTGDEWSDIWVVKDTWTRLDWSALWAPHNEDRIFFPNVVVVVLAHTVHLNIRAEELLSAVMLVAATALLIWAYKRRSPSTPWIYCCPVAILALSVVQWGNALWGFQLAWYLVLLSLAVAIVCVDVGSLTWLPLTGAIAAAIVGSFSCVQGLLIWPIGLILMYHRQRPPRVVVIWVACAIATVVLYYHHFQKMAVGAKPDYSLEHPLAAIKYFLFLVGDVVGLQVTGRQPANLAVMLFGLVIVVLALFTLVVYGIRRDPRGGRPLGLSLICFGLGFALVTTEGRAHFGTAQASASRYTTYDLLILIGMYLTLLDRPLLGPLADRAHPERSEVESSGSTTPGRLVAWVNRVGFRLARAVVIVAMVIQVIFGIPNGISGATAHHTFDVYATHILRNYRHASSSQLRRLDRFASSSLAREQARVAQQYRLTLFADLPPHMP